jgi:hypothetical protein
MRKYMLIVALLALFTPVFAQDKQPTPFPTAALSVLKPADVFTDNVDVIQTLPELNADSINSVLYYLAANSDHWELLTPPKELPNSLQTNRLQNGDFEVTEVPSDMAGPCPSTVPTFDFNPTTRAFTLQPAEKDEPNKSVYWDLFYPNPPENIRLRNYCEGQGDLYSTEIPTDVSDHIRSSIVTDRQYPHVMYSHDNLVVSTSTADEQGHYLFTVYTFANDSWSDSFPLALKGDWEFWNLGFKSDTFYFAMVNSTGEIYYKLDITNKAVNELFRTSYAQSVFSKEWDGFYYYVDYDDSHYLFYRYDLSTERRDMIAEFPCSAITDQCEALTIVEPNWWVKMSDLMFVLRGSETKDGFPYFVVDIPKTKLLYKGLFSSSNILFDWLENKPGIIMSLNEAELKPNAVAVYFDTTQADKPSIHIPYYVDDVSPDERHVIVHINNTSDGTQTVGIVDLETLAYTFITLPLDMNSLSASVSWREDGTLEVTVYALNLDGWWFAAVPLRTWIVRA